jgi:hypothetical protein
LLFSLRLSVLGWPVRVECSDPDLAPFVDSLYAGFGASHGGDEDVFRLSRSPRGWRGESPSLSSVEWRESVSGLAWLDDQLTLGAQYRRPDLLFLHAAAIAREGRVVLLVAESGGGKSTTTWAALHHGFALLSDELAPLDPATLLVHPHPRAVCLKARPPLPYELPPGTLKAPTAYYVATRLMPTPPSSALPLSMLVFISRRPDGRWPELREITPAESAARLYANSLNVLAHGGEGLDVVAGVTPRVPSFVLHSGELTRTCALLADALAR